MNNSCLVSVCVRTYNQEKYVEQAIQSVLAQKTTFNFEIIVSDDCSKDGTPNILSKLKGQNPQKIQLILGQQNIGGPMNLKRVVEASSAKYITILDADDYYVDDYKLQKQVDFLESHHEFSACFHNTVNVNENGERLSLFNPINFHSVHDANEFILQNWFVPVHSALLRREYIQFPSWYQNVVNDDYVIHLSVVQHNPYFYMPDVMVAYRHHVNNTSHAYEDLIYTDEKLCYILESYLESYPSEYKSALICRIETYKSEIKELRMMSHHPYLRLFKLKTYTRPLKVIVKRLYEKFFYR